MMEIYSRPIHFLLAFGGGLESRFSLYQGACCVRFGVSVNNLGVLGLYFCARCLPKFQKLLMNNLTHGLQTRIKIYRRLFFSLIWPILYKNKCINRVKIMIDHKAKTTECTPISSIVLESLVYLNILAEKTLSIKFAIMRVKFC